MSTQESTNIALAKNILSGQSAPLTELGKLADDLKKEKAFGYARRILARARKDPSLKDQAALRVKLAQQHALCTYKDPDLPVDIALDRALEILKEEEDLQTTKNQETLGLAGAIYKRKWEVDSQKQHLERALAYYYKGYEQGPAHDYGYTGINAAFVLDVLANQEEAEAQKAGISSESAELRRQKVQHIREDLIATLPALPEQPDKKWLEHEWWFLVTIAEAYFGLQHYQDALPWLQRAAVLQNVPDWEKESTARQLATLARLKVGNSPSMADLERSEAWQVLCEFLGNDAAGVRSAFIGKVGLALSGGGFRASLFHIGVLARLAELDLLRHVEVLSCVSGGSIIGAHYYLEVRKLLQTKPDSKITREDYLELVQRIEERFLAGVQRNIRTRVAAEFLTNLKMIFLPNHSRTQRAGELYEEEIFSRVYDGEEKKPLWLNELLVKPLGESDNFSPKYQNWHFSPKHHNWRRSAKVPILVLNATTLNTGHNWQFTASWMGEPPAGIDSEIDANYRLRRMYYHEAPEGHRKVRLGHAVAASACVPGIFEPLVLTNLYPEKTVRLVDGGVHDNQGIESLLEQGCSVLLVSDASGQMETLDSPSAGILGVPLRSNSILMARVREAQYHGLAARQRSSLLRGLMFIHLKKDLDAAPIDWLDCKDPHEASDEARPPERRGVLTSYGIHKEVQRRLAAIRTDLDSFSDAEAYALMMSGYLMTKHELPQALPDLSASDETPAPWRFLAVKEQVRGAEGSAHLTTLLDVACDRLLKVWKLSPPLRVIGSLLGVVALAGLLWACWKWASLPVLTLGTIGPIVAVVIAGAIVGKTVVRAVRFREIPSRITIGLGMASLGWIAARIHLYTFDRWYLRLGRVHRVASPSSLSSVLQPIDSAGTPPVPPQPSA